MTKMKKLITTACLAAMLGSPAAWASQPSNDDFITLNQAIGRLDDRSEKQSEAIVKLVDWFAAMKAEIDSLKAQVAAKSANPAPAPAAAPAPASAEVIPAPAYPPQPPAQPPVVQPVQPAAPAPVPAPAPASAAPAPATGQQVAAIAPDKPAERKPVAGALVKVAAYDKADRPVELLIFPAKSSAVTANDAEAALKKAGMPAVRGRAMVAMDGMLKIEGEGGKHAFSLVAEMEGRGGNRNCTLSLDVSGMKVFEQSIRIGADGKGAVFGTADIEGPGLVKVSASAANCPTLVGLSLLARPPGAATLEPAQLFYLAEAN